MSFYVFFYIMYLSRKSGLEGYRCKHGREVQIFYIFFSLNQHYKALFLTCRYNDVQFSFSKAKNKWTHRKVLLKLCVGLYVNDRWSAFLYVWLVGKMWYQSYDPHNTGEMFKIIDCDMIIQKWKLISDLLATENCQITMLWSHIKENNYFRHLWCNHGIFQSYCIWRRGTKQKLKVYEIFLSTMFKAYKVETLCQIVNAEPTLNGSYHFFKPQQFLT